MCNEGQGRCVANTDVLSILNSLGVDRINSFSVRGFRTPKKGCWSAEGPHSTTWLVRSSIEFGVRVLDSIAFKDLKCLWGGGVGREINFHVLVCIILAFSFSGW